MIKIQSVCIACKGEDTYICTALDSGGAKEVRKLELSSLKPPTCLLEIKIGCEKKKAKMALFSWQRLSSPTSSRENVLNS